MKQRAWLGGSTVTATSGSELALLKAALGDLERENERLREARAGVTRQLGPLPISAALVAGLVSAFPGTHAGSEWQKRLVIAALVAFALMVLVSCTTAR